MAQHKGEQERTQTGRSVQSLFTYRAEAAEVFLLSRQLQRRSALLEFQTECHQIASLAPKTNMVTQLYKQDTF